MFTFTKKVKRMKKTTNKKTNVPKKTKILSYLQKGKSITEEKALKTFKVKNIRATISDLREENYDIVTERSKTGTKYSLA